MVHDEHMRRTLGSRHLPRLWRFCSGDNSVSASLPAHPQMNDAFASGVLRNRPRHNVKATNIEVFVPSEMERVL